MRVAKTRAAATSSSSAVSVTSRTTARAGTECDSRESIRAVAVASSLIDCAERLTHIEKPGSIPRRRPRISRASSITHLSKTGANPERSATGTNTDGGTISPSPPTILTNASAPMIRPEATSSSGCRCRIRSSASRARSSCIFHSDCVSNRVVDPSQAPKIIMPSRPEFFASYIMMSAVMSRSIPSSIASANVVPPIDAVSARPAPSKVRAKPRILSTRSSATVCNLGRSAKGISTANSSPPRRAVTSVDRRLSLRIRAISTNTRSPSAWPKVSLISLNPSRSRTRRPPPCAYRRNCSVCEVSSRSKRRRLNNPVSGSLSAVCSSCARSRWCSVTSRMSRSARACSLLPSGISGAELSSYVWVLPASLTNVKGNRWTVSPASARADGRSSGGPVVRSGRFVDTNSR